MISAEKWVPKLFQSWEDEGIKYVVLRNYQDLPVEIGNDLDVLVTPGRRHEAVRVLIHSIKEQGGSVHHRAPFSCDSVFFYDPVSKQQFHVDIFDRITWRYFPLLEPGRVLSRRRSYNGFSVVSETDEAILNLFNHLLHGAEIREKYRPSIKEQASQELFFQGIERLLGRSLAQRTIDFIQAEQWKDIEQLRSRYRKRIGWRALIRSPLCVCSQWVSDSLRLFKRFIRPPGLFVVMVGPDGSGKSTAGLALKERLQGTFYSSRIRYFHWKARLVKQDTVPTGPPKSDPHGAALRSKPESILFFLAHAIEGIIGHWLKVKPVLFKNGLVLIDRYYYDYFVDPRRFRLQLPSWLVRFVYFFVPKPDLVFFYDAPPEVLLSRKQEVSFEECARQREAYLELAQRLPQAVIIDARQSPSDVADEVQDQVLSWMDYRRRHRYAD